VRSDAGELKFVSAYRSLRYSPPILIRKILTSIPYPRILKQKYWI
jgi:hypothetical protein